MLPKGLDQTGGTIVFIMAARHASLTEPRVYIRNLDLSVSDEDKIKGIDEFVMGDLAMRG